MRQARTDPATRAGYSILETLIVLGIMALGAAIVLPRGSAMLDRIMTHVVFFELQRDLADLRRDAYRSEQARTVAADPDAATADAPALTMRPAWSYRFDRPLVISPGGACPDLRVEVLRDGKVVMHLASADGACHFTRLD